MKKKPQPWRNILLTIEFDGTNYAGWQIQPNKPTVQGKLQTALHQLFGTETKLYGCSRTDAGVSARNYLASFVTTSTLPIESVAPALNFYLPRDIYVKSAAAVPLDFNARYSVRAKTYSYRTVLTRSPLRARHAWEYPYPLNLNRLKSAARLFLGKKDYNPFCHTKEENGFCQITSIRIKHLYDEITIFIRGDRFLYKMVRRIVGALFAYSTGRLTQQDLRAALAGKKTKSFITAPASGLTLEQVHY
ncbi:MAG: tRNA pseudouridine(38-40) synthase TruA [bacterium]